MNLILKLITVGFGTLVSRLFGFVREIFMAAALGTGPIADAFNAAFMLPNTFRRIFAEGAFNTAFVPLFARKTESDTQEEAKAFSEEVFSILFSTLLFLTLLMEFLMPWIVGYIVAPGFISDPRKYNLTIKLASIMFPYLLCMSLAAMISGMLNSLRHYLAAAIAPVFLNIILIFVLAWSYYKNYDHEAIAFSLGWGVLVAGVVQLGILWGTLLRMGVWIRFHRPRLTKNVKRLLRLAFPAALTGGITQINTLAGTAIASGIDSAISSLSYADRIHQLPLGIVGVAVSVVLLPELSRALKRGSDQQVRQLQNEAVEFSLFLTLPASTGLWILSEPIVRILYERGEFSTQNSTGVVSAILAILSLGLPAFVLIKAFTPAFIARQNISTPMIVAAICAIVNIFGAFFFSSYFGAEGVALAGVIAGWFNAAFLLALLMWYKYWHPCFFVCKRICAIVFSCAVMAITILQGMKLFPSALSSSSPFYQQASCLVILTGIGLIVYLIVSFSLGGIDRVAILYALRLKKNKSN